MKAGIVRYASVCTAIGEAIGGSRAPDCTVGAGRITLTFRGLRADQWTQAQRLAHASRVAGIARTVLAGDSRRDIRVRASRAITVVYDDRFVAPEGAARNVWELVVPAPFVGE